MDPTKYKWPFTIGADPEFTVISGTRPINAKEIFSTFFKESKETRQNGNIMGFTSEGGDIGWDGHNATGELRPKPGTPEEVVANMKKLFKVVQEKIPFIDLSTLTIAASTGGHIHLSIPQEINDHYLKKDDKWNAIERAIGTFNMMLMMSDNDLSRDLRRRGGSYGDILDFRVDHRFSHPDGHDGYVLEVRGPTAEWITSEKIALGALTYMAIAWDSIIKNDLHKIAPILFRSKTQARDTVEPLFNNFANMQKLYLDKMRPFIRSHPAYKEHKNELELIMSPQRTIEEKKKFHFSVNEGWGFTLGSKSIATNKFLNEEDIEEKTSKFPEKVIRNISTFAWNEDLHVEQFATALSKRCIALGWKPNHEYFLFGVKKGLDALIMRDETGNFVTGQEIVKNKEDYKILKNKFDRIGVKADPVYGRFINPRTGKLSNGEDVKRVMIGIPYAMRKNGDVKPLIRLVLKFEKNPKIFIPLVHANLPEGTSQLKESIQKEEEMERGIERAESNGEFPREVNPEFVEDLPQRHVGVGVTDGSSRSSSL